MINICFKKKNKIKTKLNESAYIDFPYNAMLVEKVKSLPQRYWHPQVKQWEVPIEQIPKFINMITDQPITMVCDNKTYIPQLQSKIDHERHQVTELPDLPLLKSSLLQHQKEAILYGINHDNMFLADQPGLGKTLSAIGTALSRQKLFGEKRTLIICGVNTLKWNWQSELKKHTDIYGHILGQRINNKGKVTIGTSVDKLYDLSHLPKTPFLITNVETLRNEEILNKLIDLCNSDEITTIIVDESHKCCNITAKQSKALLKLNCKNKIAMTGTPVLNKPLDLYVVLNWMGIEDHSFYEFKNYYATMGGYGGYEVVGYKHLDELSKDLNEVMLRRLKKDVVNLPDKMYITEYVEMEKPQSELYYEVKESIQKNIDKILLSPNPLTELLRLRQVTSCPAVLTTHEIDCAKLNRLDDILEERIENGSKVIVVSNWTSVTDELLKRYAKYNPATITGKVKDNERQAQQDKLTNESTCKMLIGTIGAMGVGLTLTAADTMIFVDEPWNKATEEQCEDRIHRISTTTNVNVIFMITKDTIDERIYELVREKGELADSIVDGNITRNKKNLLDFLIS